MYKQLSLLISPYSPKKDFQIRLKTGGNNLDKFELVGKSKISDYFEVFLDATFIPEKKIVSYQVRERNPKTQKRIKKQRKEIPLNQLITDTKFGAQINKINLGPVRILLYYFPRNKNTLLGSDFNVRELSDYLKENAGIKLYRDNIRVMPYGEMNSPGGDWLNLGNRFAQNPAGRSRPSHRIRPKQLIGAIFIGRDENPELSDSASREGLIQYDSFRLLNELVIGCVRLVEARSHEIFIKQEKLKNVNNEKKEIIDLNKQLDNLQVELKVIASTLSKYEDIEIKEIGTSVIELVPKLNSASNSVELLESQTRLFRGLATIGIASVVFGHETQTRISRVIGAVSLAKEFIEKTPPEIPSSIKNLKIAKNAAEKVLAWGGFALDRIRRDKRVEKDEPIYKIVMRIYDEIKSPFQATGISFDVSSIDQDIRSRIYQIDVESIILNLLTNAYSACKQVNKNRKIKIKLVKRNYYNQEGFSIIVSDSGPGVNESLRSIIWEPTFTTKTIEKGAGEEGTGMGLAIIDGIVKEMNGLRRVDDDPDLGGARFEIWLPIII